MDQVIGFFDRRYAAQVKGDLNRTSTKSIYGKPRDPNDNFVDYIQSTENDFADYEKTLDDGEKLPRK